jgi:photosystem II stability/assembly factor-like uncharacterized protein
MINRNAQSRLVLIILSFTIVFGSNPVSAQWIAQNSGTSISLSSLFCINADAVFAVGNSGTILKTTDGVQIGLHKIRRLQMILIQPPYLPIIMGVSILSNSSNTC